MQNKNTQRFSTETMVLGAILTALVVVLQMLGQFIKFGPFSISLVLIPIVIGAATCGYKISAWLGFVFGIVVLMTDSAAFLAVDVLGTVVTVLAKGTFCGLASGLVYQLLKKKAPKLSVWAAAIVCPIVNTGIFVLGCYAFFLPALNEWAAAGGFANATAFIFVGMVGLNFLVEFAVNVVLSPMVTRLLRMLPQLKK